MDYEKKEEMFFNIFTKLKFFILSNFLGNYNFLVLRDIIELRKH